MIFSLSLGLLSAIKIVRAVGVSVLVFSTFVFCKNQTKAYAPDLLLPSTPVDLHFELFGIS